MPCSIPLCTMPRPQRAKLPWLAIRKAWPSPYLHRPPSRHRPPSADRSSYCVGCPIWRSAPYSPAPNCPQITLMVSSTRSVAVLLERSCLLCALPRLQIRQGHALLVLHATAIQNEHVVRIGSRSVAGAYCKGCGARQQALSQGQASKPWKTVTVGCCKDQREVVLPALLGVRPPPEALGLVAPMLPLCSPSHHALQRVLGPSGPHLHWGVTQVEQLAHLRTRPGFLAGSLIAAIEMGWGEYRAGISDPDVGVGCQHPTLFTALLPAAVTQS